MSLTITIPDKDMFDEKKSEFFTIHGATITLEHSLVSVSKWESIWKKPFISKDPKTQEETISYIKCMTLTKNVNPDVYKILTIENFNEIEKYIEDPMTATWFSEQENKNKNRRVVTAELIYYWMIALNIPVEFQKWHFNRLITLIQVCNEESGEGSKKRLSKRELLERNHRMNEARRAASRARSGAKR